MDSAPHKRLFQLPGPILSLTLIGILILSAVLYYRAVKIQRFLEPALAITTPRSEFSSGIKRMLFREFGSGGMKGVRFGAGSIFVEKTLLTRGIHGKNSDSTSLGKLGRVFLYLLKDPDMKRRVDFILVSLKLPVHGTGEYPAGQEKRQMEERAGLLLNSLFRVSPELAKNYRPFFAVTVVSGDFSKNETEWVEFRFIPTDRLHIDVLESLKKYVR